MTSNSYYITTPIYYVNDLPHIGHAYTTIAADVLARFNRLHGKKVMFLTGTDEHGQKVAKSAEAAGMDPQSFVDSVSVRFRELLPVLKCTPDQFIRTTEDRHKIAATAMWNLLLERDQIYQSKYEGWYSVRDEAFYLADDLIDGKAPTGAEVQWMEEPSYFFRLSQWQEPLLKFYDENPDFIGPKSRRNEVVSFVKRGLKDLSISRSTFTWGVPVPNDSDHVMYVWIEALTNYLTAIGFPDGDYQELWDVAIHLVGKDIVMFHAVYWPAILMAAGLKPPKRIFAHGWWTNEGQKISKSLGNTIDPIELVNSYGVDQVRYFMMREVPFGSDADFSKTALVQRTNSDLANDIGNLAQRVLSFIYKHCDGKIPQHLDLEDADKAILLQASNLTNTVAAEAEDQEINKMLQSIWDLVGSANRYVDIQAPWSLRKENIQRMNTVLFVLADVIRHLAVHIQIITPVAAENLLDTLCIPVDERDFKSLEQKTLAAGHKINEPKPIFPRIE